MDIQSLSVKELSTLVDRLLKSRDPASVTVLRILKKKQQLSNGFPLQTMRYDQFSVSSGVGDSPLSDEERRIIALEKKTADLTAELEARMHEARQAVQEAYSKGLAEGRIDGERLGQERANAEYEKKLTEVRQRFASMLQEYESVRRAMIVSTQQQLVQLSCLIARKVLHSEISLRSDVVLHVVKAALGYIADRDRIVIRVCPADLETVSGKQDFWRPVAEGMERIDIVADERISRGGCIIESTSGVVDGRIEAQLAELEQLVEKTWECLKPWAQESVVTEEQPTCAQAHVEN